MAAVYKARTTKKISLLPEEKFVGDMGQGIIKDLKFNDKVYLSIQKGTVTKFTEEQVNTFKSCYALEDIEAVTS